jgi:hypothetical protein
MDKTWKPMVAGILNMVTGTFALLSVIGLVIAIVVIESGFFVEPGIPDFATTVYWFFVGIPSIVFIAQSKDEFE